MKLLTHIVSPSTVRLEPGVPPEAQGLQVLVDQMVEPVLLAPVRAVMRALLGSMPTQSCRPVCVLLKPIAVWLSQDRTQRSGNLLLLNSLPP